MKKSFEQTVTFNWYWDDYHDMFPPAIIWLKEQQDGEYTLSTYSNDIGDSNGGATIIFYDESLYSEFALKWL